jgi:hypothetical protein
MTDWPQVDLLGPLPTPTAVLREEARFGARDAQSGLPLRNHYSTRISGDRLAAYEGGFRAARRSEAE